MPNGMASFKFMTEYACLELCSKRWWQAGDQVSKPSSRSSAAKKYPSCSIHNLIQGEIYVP